ncbi:MAG: CvpA family protein [Cyclobacteriaceae bacterium]|nr:CvpA family protein [Cyclobacteriaceae bacterium]
MNILDIVLLLFLGFAAYRGYQRGLFVSLLSIVAFFLGIILAFALLDWGVDLLDDYIEELGSLLPFVAFFMIFGGVAMLITIGGGMVKKAMDLTLLGSVDNLAGALLGALKWMVGASLIIWLVQSFGVEIPDDMQESSWLFAKIQPIAPWIIENLSEYWPFIKELFESIKERLNPSLI